MTPADFEAAHAVAAECDAEAREVIATLLSTISMVDGDAPEPRNESEQRGLSAAMRVAMAPEPHPSRTPAARAAISAAWDAREGIARANRVTMTRAMRTMSTEGPRVRLGLLKRVSRAGRQQSGTLRCVNLGGVTVTWWACPGQPLASTRLGSPTAPTTRATASFPRDGGEDARGWASEAHRWS